MRAFSSTDGTTHLLRLPPGTDLYDGITEAAKDLGLRTATVTAIGALRSFEYGYYDQETKEYERLDRDGEVEIASANGNISLRDGEPFLHLHAVIGLQDGSALGGHVFGGEVFVAEVTFRDFGDGGPERALDDAIGLPMWPCE